MVSRWANLMFYLTQDHHPEDFMILLFVGHKEQVWP